MAAERERIDHLLSLLAKREAPAAEAWWMDDQTPKEPVLPPNAIISEDGMNYWVPDDADE